LALKYLLKYWELTGEHPYSQNFPERLEVFRWHEDTFDLPKEAIKIYSSEKYPNQVFIYKNAVGLQFHIEII